MIAFILKRLVSSVAVLFAVVSISFLIMRLSPGSPFDRDKALPDAVVSNQAKVLGMANETLSPTAGIIDTIHVSNGKHVSAGETLMTIRTTPAEPAPLETPDMQAATYDIRLKTDCKVFRILKKAGQSVETNQPLLYCERSMLKQYVSTLKSLSLLNFGVTFDSIGQKTVLSNIKETFPVSAELGIIALLIALIIGIPLGLISAIYQHSLWDRAIMTIALLGISVSTIVVGPTLISIFVTRLKWLPIQGGWSEGGWQVKILPAITMGLIYAAYFSRLARGGYLEVAQKPWIRTARAKGLSPTRITVAHALRASILPIISYLGPATAGILVGSVVVEQIFNVPGISKYFITSAINRDFPMVMGVVVLYSALLVALNLIVDITYALLDPRLRQKM